MGGRCYREESICRDKGSSCTVMRFSAHCSYARQLGAKTITLHPLLAFFALFTGPSALDNHPDTDNDHRTLIEATPDGWFYSALLSREPSCSRIAAFHTLPTHPAAKRARRHGGFLDILHASTAHVGTLV